MGEYMSSVSALLERAFRHNRACLGELNDHKSDLVHIYASRVVFQNYTLASLVALVNIDFALQWVCSTRAYHKHEVVLEISMKSL